MAKRSNSRAAGPAVVDPDDQLDLSGITENDQVAISEEWVPEFLNPANSFFDAIAGIPESGWEKSSIYLYRLWPEIQNKQGEKKYIGVYGGPISEEGVKLEHGGGKYHAYVKYGADKKKTVTLRNHRFWIDGDPVYKEGQTARGAAAAGPPVAGAPAQQDIGSIVRQVIEATGGNSKAADAGIEVMKRAFTDGLDLQKSISTRQAESTTGSPFGDKLFDQLLPRLLAPPAAPATDPIILKLVEAAISNMKADRREANPAPAAAAPASDQLALVKELMGVESLREIIEMGGRGKEQPWWVTVLSNAVEKLPTLLSEYANMQERGFQRAIIAHQLGAGHPVQQQFAPVPARTGQPVPPQQAPSMPISQPSSGTMSEQMVHAIVDAICKVYDEGYPGDFAAAHIKMLYPELVASLAPLLGDQTQLVNFIAGMPPLADRAREEDWAEFQQEFVEEIRPHSEQPQRANGVSRETIPDVQPPRKMPAKKKAASGPTVVS